MFRWLARLLAEIDDALECWDELELDPGAGG
jgi:hypothetical protein